MAKPHTIKLDVRKIDKAFLFEGKARADGSRPFYLDIALFPNTKPSSFGDTHYAVQSLPKEARDAGKKGAILGNATLVEEAPKPQQREAPKSKSDEAWNDVVTDDQDSIPW